MLMLESIPSVCTTLKRELEVKSFTTACAVAEGRARQAKMQEMYEQPTVVPLGQCVGAIV